MFRKFLSRFLLLAFTCLAAAVVQAGQDAPLTIILTSIPADTPPDATIYVAGTFNDWQTDDQRYRLSRNDRGEYAITIPVRGEVAFKFTLGSWDNGEQDEQGVDSPNRQFKMPSSGPATYSGTVVKWRQPAHSIAELRAQLEKILAESKTPGMMVAIVRRDGGTEWAEGLGLADVAAKRPATADTLFRIGSVSKAFAAMSILKLADEGKLSLQDSVRKLAPEVSFENPWEDTDPVRVADLLEHTTGWDDIHLAEYAKDGAGMTTLQGLEFYKGSRLSRWRPGTRMSYCNAGPAVAAYIVEKLTGKRFEDYVTETFFRPLGMASATYFQPPAEQIATGYFSDGQTPFPYWHIVDRAAGAINASAKDMAAYLSFYLKRGAQVLPSGDVERMETPTRTWAARQGLVQGYGLYNYSYSEDGLVYHGHTGGVAGGLTWMAYLPEQGIGYAFSINGSEGFERINQAIRGYVTQGIAKLSVPPIAELPADAADYAGWYEPDSPRVEMTRFAVRLAGLTQLRLGDGKMVFGGLIGPTKEAYPVGGNLLRLGGGPVPNMILLAPTSEGHFVEAYGMTFRQIPASLVWSELGLTALFVLAAASILLYALVWLPASLRPKWRRPQELWVKLWPLLAVASLGAAAAIIMLIGEDLITRLGNPTPWSIGLFAATSFYGVATLAGAVSWWRAWGKARRWVMIHAAWVAIMLLIGLGYLGYWGMIGLRSWA